MSEFSNTVKSLLADGIRFVNRTANSVAGATRYKLEEMDSLSSRRETIVELGEKVYSLYQAGVQMPAELAALLQELSTTEENLKKIRNDRAEQKIVNAQEREAERAVRAEKRAENQAVRAQARAEAKAVRDVERAEAKAARDVARAEAKAAREEARAAAKAAAEEEAAAAAEFEAALEAAEAEAVLATEAETTEKPEEENPVAL